MKAKNLTLLISSIVILFLLNVNSFGQKVPKNYVKVEVPKVLTPSYLADINTENLNAVFKLTDAEFGIVYKAFRKYFERKFEYIYKLKKRGKGGSAEDESDLCDYYKQLLQDIENNGLRPVVIDNIRYTLAYVRSRIDKYCFTIVVTKTVVSETDKPSDADVFVMNEPDIIRPKVDPEVGEWPPIYTAKIKNSFSILRANPKAPGRPEIVSMSY